MRRQDALTNERQYLRAARAEAHTQVRILSVCLVCGAFPCMGRAGGKEGVGAVVTGLGAMRKAWSARGNTMAGVHAAARCVCVCMSGEGVYGVGLGGVGRLILALCACTWRGRVLLDLVTCRGRVCRRGKAREG